MNCSKCGGELKKAKDGHPDQIVENNSMKQMFIYICQTCKTEVRIFQDLPSKKFLLEIKR